MNWLVRALGLDRHTLAESDYAEAEAAHRRSRDHADWLLAKAARKAKSILEPYTGPERRKNPR